MYEYGLCDNQDRNTKHRANVDVQYNPVEVSILIDEVLDVHGHFQRARIIKRYTYVEGFWQEREYGKYQYN